VAVPSRSPVGGAPTGWWQTEEAGWDAHGDSAASTLPPVGIPAPSSTLHAPSPREQLQVAARYTREHVPIDRLYAAAISDAASARQNRK